MKQWKSLLDFELDGANAFYLLHALSEITTHEFITLVGSRQRNFDKCRISPIYQPAEQKLLNVENIFKDTVDLRECISENSLNGLFGVQPNYKTMKRM